MEKNKTYLIRRECCVCKIHLGDIEGGDEPGLISRSYCEKCLADGFGDILKDVQE